MPTSFDFDAIMLYFNIGILIMIGIGAFGGFFRGMFKSTYSLIVFVLLLLIGWFISPIFAKALMGFDVSSYTSNSFDGIALTTLEDFVPKVIAKNAEMQDVLVKGTLAHDLVLSGTFMFLRLAFIIVWLVLMATVFKFIFWIIYLFIKPRGRGKKSMYSRFSGALVGAMHAVLFVFLLSIPISGLCSIGSSLLTLNEQDNVAQLKLSINEEGAVLEKLANENPMDEYEEVFKFMDEYRTTVSGKISGFVKINGEPLDEYLFDEVISLKYEGNKVGLKTDIQRGIKIYNILYSNLGNEINLDTISSLDDEILNEVFDEISQLKVLKVGIPAGVEYAVNSNMISDVPEEIDLNALVDELLNIDYGQEVKNIGQVIVQLNRLGLLTTNIEPTQMVGLEVDTVKSMFNSFGSLELINVIGKYGIDYLEDSKPVLDFYTKNGITKGEVNLDNFNLGNEIKNIGNVYEAFYGLNIVVVDNQTVDLINVTDDAINDFGVAIYDSQFLSDNSSVIAKVLFKTLPDEYQNVLVVNQFELEDFTSILSLGKVLVNSGVLSENGDPMLLLTDENIDKISQYISTSNLMSSNISGVLELLLSQVDMPITLEVPEDITFYGSEGKTELVSLFSTAQKLVDLGVGSTTFGDNLTPEKIDELADVMSESNVLMSNVDSILDYILSDSNLTGGITITVREDIDWTTDEGKTEFKALLNAISVIVEADLLTTPDFTTLSDGTTDTNGDGVVDENDDNIINDLAVKLSSSIVIKDNLSNIINQVTEGQTSDFTIEVFDSPDEWTETELDSLLRSIKIINGKTNLPEDLFTLSDDELDIVLTSKLISNSIVTEIEKQSAVDGDLYDLLITDGVTIWDDTYDDITGERTDGELRKLFTSASILLGDNPDFSNPDNVINVNNLLNLSDGSVDPSDDKLGELLSSRVLKDSIVNQLIKYGTDKTDELGNVTEKAVLVVNMDKENPGWDNEIRSFLKSTKIFLGTDVDLNNINIDLNKIKTLSTGDVDPSDDEVKDILESVIMTDTIIDNIIEFGVTDDGSESSLVVNLTAEDPRWRDSEGNDGEIRTLIKSIQLVLKEEDDLNSNFSFDINSVLDLTDPELSTITSSIIIVDTSVRKLNDMTKDATETEAAGSLNGVLYLPDEETTNYYGSDGELKKFFISLQYLVEANTTEGQGVEDMQNISLSSLSGENQATILASEIISLTIITNVEKEATKADSAVKLAPELDKTNPAYNEAAWDNELPSLLDSLQVFLGADATLDSIAVDSNKFLNLTDPEITTITASRVMSYSIVSKIEEERNNDASLLTLPNELNPDQAEYDESLWYGENGELTKTLKALRELGLATYDANFSITPILSEAKGETEEVILASKVVEATIINKITKEATTGTLVNTLIIPNNVVWERTVVDDVETEKGELRRFLMAIDIILEGKELETATFSVEKFFNTPENPTRQDTLLASLIVEASVVNKIDTEAATGGSLDGTLVYPTNWQQDDWYGVNGELRRFLASIEILIGTGTFETVTFEVDKFFNTPEEPTRQDTLLESRLIEASAIKFIKESDKLTIPDPSLVSKYYYLSNENVIWERTYQNDTLTDIGELRRFLTGVKELIGTDTYENLVFNMDNMLATDFSVVLDSKVLEATVADMTYDLITTGILGGFIATPVDGYQWYSHLTSTELGNVGAVRRGEFVLTPTTYQNTDLEGLLISIQEMNNTGLNFNSINLQNIVSADSTLLSEALWDYSRVMRGSIATMLNEAIDRANPPAYLDPVRPTFTNDQFTTKQDVKDALDTLATFVGMLP